MTNPRDAHQLVQVLHDTLSRAQSLYEFKRGSGVAAPQIGELYRVSVIEYEGIRYELINPEVLKASEEKILISEGCLSFFSYRGEVERHSWVCVSATDSHGEIFQIEGEGDLASLLQHELDHLDGRLFVDRIPGGEAALVPCKGLPEIP